MKAAKVFRGVDRFLGVIDPAIVALGLTALMASAGLLFLGVILRYYFSQTIGTFEELAVNLVVWAVMLFGGPVLKRGSHVGMGFLAEKLDVKKRAVQQLIIHLFLLFICGILIWKGLEIVQILYQIGKTTQSGDLKMWYLTLPVPAGCTLYGIYGVAGIIKGVCALIDPTLSLKASSSDLIAT